MVNVDKKAEENELVRSEMTYLVNVVGSRAHGQKFGSIPGDDSAKKLLSDKFAGELDNRVNGWISK